MVHYYETVSLQELLEEACFNMKKEDHAKCFMEKLMLHEEEKNAHANCFMKKRKAAWRRNSSCKLHHGEADGNMKKKTFTQSASWCISSSFWAKFQSYKFTRLDIEVLHPAYPLTKQRKRGKKPDGRKLVEAWCLKKNDLNWRPGNNLVAIIQPVSAVTNRRTKNLSSSLLPSSSFWCTQNTHSSLRNLRGGPQNTWRSPRVEESVMVVVFFLFPPKIAWSALFLNLDGDVKPQYNSHSYWKLALHKWHSSCNTTIAC